jgi:hypothetical protein
MTMSDQKDKINCHDGEQMFPNYTPEWQEREGIEHCNYCGSVRPERAVSALVDGRATNIEWADFKYGWPHKLYLTIDDKWSKFYSIHLKDLPAEEFEKVRKVLIEKTGMDFMQEGDRLKWRRTTTGTQL